MACQTTAESVCTCVCVGASGLCWKCWWPRTKTTATHFFGKWLRTSSWPRMLSVQTMPRPTRLAHLSVVVNKANCERFKLGLHFFCLIHYRRADRSHSSSLAQKDLCNRSVYICRRWWTRCCFRWFHCCVCVPCCTCRSSTSSVMSPSLLSPTKALHVTWIRPKNLSCPPNSSSYKTRQDALLH